MEVGTADSLAAAMGVVLRTITAATGWEYGEGWVRTRGVAQPGQAAILTREACWPRAGKRFAELREAAPRIQAHPELGLPVRFWNASRGRWLPNIKKVSESLLARRDEASRAGVNAVAVVPIFDDGRSAAMLLLFVCRRHADDKDVLKLICNAMTPLGHLVRHKLAEDELARHHKQLERIVEERTGQLERSRAQLILSDRMASLGTLAAGLGHDMNNVLLPVRANLNALRSKEQRPTPCPSRLAHLDSLEKSIAYLQQLADGLRFLALDPDNDDSAGDGAGTELHQWWAQTGVLLSKAVPRHVRVSTSLPSGLPRVGVATHRLTQAVLNLVVNAGEAIPEDSADRQGSVRIWARAETGADGVVAVRVSVTDNGTGMSEEVQRRSFEMFYSTKVRRSGAGLGLAMVRRMVERVHGAVEIESQLGHGTTVSMVLPAVAVRDAADAGSDAGPLATVAVSDGRAAALMTQVLQASGARTGGAEGAATADIRVEDAKIADIQALKAWRTAKPSGSLVLFGRPPARQIQNWKILNPIVIREPRNLEAVRDALRQAIASGSKKGATAHAKPAS